MAEDKTMQVEGAERALTAIADFPDIRDRFYEPPLIALEASVSPKDLFILDQGKEGACTGFATAAALNILRRRQGLMTAGDSASPRMLYEMAKIHDEWSGSDYEGSSIRGAIKGFFHNGACLTHVAPYVDGEQGWSLTVDQAKNARELTLGAYYRLRPILVDYHAALQQAGVIIASATVHPGWSAPDKGKIVYSKINSGGHAFAIVGYDQEGFIIQNSWGTVWGNGGIAHWSYHDWAETIIDAWVMRLAVPTPAAFELTHRVPRAAGTELPDTNKYSPRRQDVIGHIIHIDDGKLITTGTYATPLASLEETAALLRAGAQKEGEDRKYDHLLFYAHGGVTDAVAAARKTAALREGFKRNRIYPIHFLWETGLIEEVGDILAGQLAGRGGKIAGFEEQIDHIIEKLSAGIGRALWREMKGDAARSFDSKADSATAVRTMLEANKGLKRPLKVHLVGHSAGSNFVGEFVNAWRTLAPKGINIKNCFVLGAACTVDQYTNHFLPALVDGRLGHLTVYNLSDQRERDDSVGPYSKSLLYLVSRAFEEKPKTSLLGMDIYSRALEPHRKCTILYTVAKGRDRTDATSHGGYGSDLVTLNDILKTVLGTAYNPTLAFRPEELAGV